MAQKKGQRDMSRKPDHLRKRGRSRLKVGDRVRVKDGVRDPDYEGHSIGGWTGAIINIDDSSDPPLILLEWDARTLTELIGKKALERAEREGLQGDDMWLYLTDVEWLAPTPGMGLRQPVNHTPKPKRRDDVPLTDEERRVTQLFGLPESAGPPAVDDATLEVYHEYLCTHMRCPFEGEYSRETRPLQHTSYRITVTGLADVYDCEAFYGLLCEGTQGRRHVERVKQRTRQRILAYAEQHYAGKYTRLDVRFRGQFCYIDAYTDPQVAADFPPPGWPESRQEHIDRLRNTPTHLCRLRYFGDEDRWSMAFYTYSHETYEPCFFDNGSDHGTPEEGFATAAVYLQD